MSKETGILIFLFSVGLAIFLWLLRVTFEMLKDIFGRHDSKK